MTRYQPDEELVEYRKPTQVHDVVHRNCPHLDATGRKCINSAFVTKSLNVSAEAEHRHAFRPTVAEHIDFERTWPTHAGAKEMAIRDTWGIGPSIYYAYLDLAFKTEEALELDAELVHRFTTARDARMAARASRTFTRTT